MSRLLQMASSEDWSYVELELDPFNSTESYLVLKLVELLDLGPLESYTKLTLTLLTGAIDAEEIERRREVHRSQVGQAVEQFELLGSEEDDRPPGEAGVHSCS